MSHSYIAFAAHQDLTGSILEKASHFEAQWAGYCREYSGFTTLEDFVNGIERLLRMPAS